MNVCNGQTLEFPNKNATSSLSDLGYILTGEKETAESPRKTSGKYFCIIKLINKIYSHINNVQN